MCNDPMVDVASVVEDLKIKIGLGEGTPNVEARGDIENRCRPHRSDDRRYPRRCLRFLLGTVPDTVATGTGK